MSWTELVTLAMADPLCAGVTLRPSEDGLEIMVTLDRGGRLCPYCRKGFRDVGAHVRRVHGD